MTARSVRHHFCEALERRTLLSIAIKPTAGLQTIDDKGLPRYLTQAEQDYISTHTLVTPANAVTAPPTGPITPVAEYAPMEGLVITWMSYTSELTQICKRVTDVGGRMYIGVTSAGVQSSATTLLNNASVNMSLVTFYIAPLDSVWARDYGPRYVYEGDVRVITDHQYNRPTRPNDDNEPVAFGKLKKEQVYQIGLNGTNLIHGGGNFHLEADGDAYATTLVTDENPSFTSTQIQQMWKSYENDNVTIVQRFPTTVDSTGHIDMWMYIWGDKKVFISDWPNNSGSTQDVICDNTAALMASRGYQVTRLPAYSISGVHYTFANMVEFNNIIIMPTYTNNSTVTSASATALAAVQNAVAGTGKTVYTISGNNIVSAAGVWHCIVQHVPIEKGLPGVNGGLAPVAYLRGPNNGESFQASDQYNLQWITDDDAPTNASGGVQSVDILLSTDGGQTFSTTIASNQPALGSFTWTVPSGIDTSQARIRILAHDGVGNTGFDDSDMDFTIGHPTSRSPNKPALDVASDTGSSSSDSITRLNNASGAAALIFDVPGTYAGATVNVYIDGVLMGTSVASGATTTVATDGTTTLLDGTHNITARQIESGKPQSPDSALLSITVDTAAPSITSPGNQTFEIVNTAGTSVSFSPAGASDAIDPSPIVDYDYAIGSSFLPGATDVIATATDAAGNFSQTSFSITLNDSPFISREPGAAYAFTGSVGSQTLTISAGQVTFVDDASLYKTGLTVRSQSGANLLLGKTQHLSSLIVDASGLVAVIAGGDKLIVTGDLSIDSTATLDLNDNDMLVNYTGGAHTTAIQTLVNAARAGGSWSGFGVTSTSAKNAIPKNTTLGVMPASDYLTLPGTGGKFDGENITGFAVLLKYTYYGDANFNGKVDGGDYARIDTAFGKESTAGNIGGWINGDFNGDGKVDGSDYGYIDSTFNSQGAVL